MLKWLLGRKQCPIYINERIVPEHFDVFLGINDNGAQFDVHQANYAHIEGYTKKGLEHDELHDIAVSKFNGIIVLPRCSPLELEIQSTGKITGVIAHRGEITAPTLDIVIARPLKLNIDAPTTRTLVYGMQLRGNSYLPENGDRTGGELTITSDNVRIQYIPYKRNN